MPWRENSEICLTRAGDKVKNGSAIAAQKETIMKSLQFSTLLFTALALAPGLAHLLELPGKIGLSKADYLTVQQIYRGWSLLGIVVIAAMLCTLLFSLSVREKMKAFGPAVIAFLCIAGTQVLFWTFTYPANTATQNWTVLPENWESLRRQWEYSHAGSAILNLLAFVMVSLSVLSLPVEKSGRS